MTSFAPPPGHPTTPFQPLSDSDEAWAMLGYLAIPVLSAIAPAVVLLLRGRSSGYVRRHALQAINLAITTFLYGVSAAILGGVLALDGPAVALVVAGPILAAIWLAALGYLIRAAVAASLGGFYPLPRWLCAAIVG
jgi:uncharacterized Tic20 family protein